MNKYELALVLSPALDDEGRAAEVAKVQAVLERFGAKIEKVDDWGKRKLAYEIQKVNEGFYSFTTFEAPHFIHLVTSITCFFFTSPEMALTGHWRAHNPQPLHASVIS